MSTIKNIPTKEKGEGLKAIKSKTNDPKKGFETIRVKFLQNHFYGGVIYRKGEFIEVPSDVGFRLIERTNGVFKHVSK